MGVGTDTSIIILHSKKPSSITAILKICRSGRSGGDLVQGSSACRPATSIQPWKHSNIPALRGGVLTAKTIHPFARAGVVAVIPFALAKL